MRRIRLFNHAIYLELLMLFVWDFVTHLGSVFLVIQAGFASESLSPVKQSTESLVFEVLLFAAVMAVSLVSMGYYRNGTFHGSWAPCLRRLTLAYAAGLFILGVVLPLIPGIHMRLGLFVTAALISSMGLLLARAILRTLADEAAFEYRLMVLGTGERARGIENLVSSIPVEVPRAISGYMYLEGDQLSVDSAKVLYLNGTLSQFVSRKGISAIVVAADERRQKLPINELLQCRLNGVRIMNLETFYEIEQKNLRLDLVIPGWLAFSEGFNRNLLNSTGERLLDITIAAILHIFTTPIILLNAVAIKFEEGWAAPMLFTQTRVGEGGKNSLIYKIRSMKADAERDGQALWAGQNDDRVTRVGAIARKFRVDELPQLFNVLKGDMSLVGPRPERPDFVQELTRKIPYYGERHRVRPGITDWVQIKYSYGASNRGALEKLQFVLYYINNHCLFLYLLIVLLSRSGSVQQRCTVTCRLSASTVSVCMLFQPHPGLVSALVTCAATGQVHCIGLQSMSQGCEY